MSKTDYSFGTKMTFTTISSINMVWGYVLIHEWKINLWCLRQGDICEKSSYGMQWGGCTEGFFRLWHHHHKDEIKGQSKVILICINTYFELLLFLFIF